MAPVASADPVEAPNPGEVYIQDITYNGSGCPIGTVAENVSDDNQAFTLTFSDYIAEAGPGVSIRDGRRNCQVTLDLHVPQGWQFSLASFDYRGYVFLDEGMQAVHSTFITSKEVASTAVSQVLWTEQLTKITHSAMKLD